MIFGNFNDLIIGQWSAADVLVDPYSGSNSGTVRIVVFHDVDIAVRHQRALAQRKITRLHKFDLEGGVF